MGLGLVLEGGAMRGMYTAGVLDVFMENGITADCAVGVSAGALFGVNLLSGQKGRVIRYNKRFNSDPDYMGIRPLLREGNIVSTRFAYHDVPHTLDPFDDEAFRASGIPFYAVVTNIRTGKPEYIRIRSVFDQMDTLRASGSMPLVSKPVSIGAEQYLDGGISDSVPFRWLSEQGCSKLIVVLTRDLSYRKKPAPAILELYRLKHPQVAALMRSRHTRYNQCIDELKQWEAAGKAFVIRPSRPIKISSLETNPEKLQEIYDLGASDAKACLSRLQDYIGGENPCKG